MVEYKKQRPVQLETKHQVQFCKQYIEWHNDSLDSMRAGSSEYMILE